MRPNLQTALPIDELDRPQILWVQQQLIRGGYLDCKADGIVGDRTRRALAEFKADNHLEYPHAIGRTTVDALASLAEPDPVSEQVSHVAAALNPNAGERSGASLRLVTGETIFANQWIVEGVPLTWGEMLRPDLSRRPESKQIVENIHRTARVFGESRAKFGSPWRITSGYRPPAVNARVGGARLSQHLHGLALDVIPLNGDMKRLTEILKANPRIGGIGLHSAFRHMDLRSGRAIFRYGR